MADQLSLRGGTTAEHATFTGAHKEVTVDTTKKTLVVNDGATVGGHPLMRENASNSALALGSASTPSLKWDANTGIYSPGADQLAVATNGVGRLFIDADGRLLVNLTSSSSRFHVKETNTNTIVGVLEGSGAYAYQSLQASGTTAGAVRVGANANDFVINAGASERLRITSAGLVGIGTSAPGALLDLRQPTSASEQEHLRIVGGQRSSDGFAVGVRILTGAVSNNSNRHLRIINSGNTIFQHYETSTNTPVPDRHILLCPDGGRVGIGTTSPGFTLDVNGNPGFGTTGGVNKCFIKRAIDGTANSYIGYLSTNSTDFAVKNGSGAGDVILEGNAGNIRFNTASSTERARIDSSGRLLVGTSSVSGLAAAKTVVVETTAAAVQRLIGNTAAQGSAQKITVVRYYPIISLGTKLIIPFVSQVSANTVTLCKVTGLRNQFNSNSPLPFEINFAVGHTNALFNLSSYGGQGNFASIAASGLNVEITFTTAYASGGIIVCIEYLTSSPLSSIDVPNIATN